MHVRTFRVKVAGEGRVADLYRSETKKSTEDRWRASDLLFRFFTARAPLFTRNITKDLLDVHAATGIRGLLAFGTFDSSTHDETPREVKR